MHVRQMGNKVSHLVIKCISYSFWGDFMHNTPRYLQSKAASKLTLADILAHAYRVLLIEHHGPLLPDHIPVTHIPSEQRELHLDTLARLDSLLSKASQLLWRRILSWNAQIQLCDFRGRGVASVPDSRTYRNDCLPQTGVATLFGDVHVFRQLTEALGAHIDGQIRVLECSVGETKPEWEARGDVAGNERLVINVHSLGEVALEVVVASRGGEVRAEKGAVVAFPPGDGVRKTTGEALAAVKKLYESATGVLARQVAVDDGCDVGVFEPGVNEADAGVVDDDHGVVAL